MNIIQLDLSRLPAVPKKREGFCQHTHVLVDEKTRMLECDACGQVIDPYDFMWEWATRDRNLQWTRDALKKDIAILRAEMEELKREERNIKSRLRRIK